MNTSTTKAERNARVLDGFILAGEAECAWLMAEVEAKRAADPEAAERLRAQWGRVSRRTMQAMVLDDKLDRSAAEARHVAKLRAPPAEPDPEIQRRRTDILAQFRIDGLDHDEEIALKDLLDEMDDDEILAYPVLQHLGRLAEHLNWEPHSAVVEAAPAPKPAAARPRLVASEGEQGPSEPERSAIWRRQMAQIERERAAREAEARARDGPDTS